ncbi:LamG-like jellyroll fold domain-containing protein [Kitasatospora sp. NPDC008050]|uniref:LamG-like jellyroll fold domain-containing protein n=1 Tax=Kitasatospora sp. NPDC008050 TaxID=3364021 RepID=UPI0036EAB1E2
MTFAPTADAPALVDLPIDAGHEVAYSLQGALPVTGTASGDTLTYANAATSADVEYNALAAGAKETLVLHDASAPSVWTFPLQLTGLIVALDASGNAVFTDAAGQVRLTIPHAFMQDSAIDPKSDQGAMSDAVTYQITAVNGAPALQMSLDAGWLHDPHRVFPVRVDPTTSNINAAQSTYVMSPFTANYSTDSVLKVGTYDGGAHVANAYLLFPGVSSVLSNDYVESAGLALDDVWSYDCGQHEVDVSAITASWSPTSVNTYPGVNIGAQIGKGNFGAGTSCTSGPAWEEVHLGDSPTAAGSQLIGSWAAGGSNFGLAVTASGTDTNAWKQFASVNSSYPPYLYVTYADWAASSTLANSYTQPTYNATGSQLVTMTNRGSQTWNPSNMQLRARVFDSTGTHELSVNAPSVPVSGIVTTGNSWGVNGIIPILPQLGQTYVLCWDAYANGMSLHDSFGIGYQGCINVTGQNTPPQLDYLTPLSGSVMGTLVPQLAAVGHDPDNYPGTGLSYDFQVYSSGRQLLKDSGWLSGPSAQAWAVPAGVLAWNSSYYWQAEVGDGVSGSAWSPMYAFSTQVQQPPITSHLGGAASDGQGHSFDPQVGNYTTSATDASVAAVGPALAVTRSYNSLDPRTGSLFGAGWTSAWDMRVQQDADGQNAVVLTDASGRAERLGLASTDGSGNTSYTPAPGEYETLTGLSGGANGYTLLLKNGMQYSFLAPVNGLSALSSVKDAAGHVQSLHYTNGKLDTVTDVASGRALHFAWTSDGRHVAKVTTDPVSGSDQSTALTWTYSYNSGDADLLIQACAPPTGGNTQASCTVYSYTDGSHLRSAMLDAGPMSYWRLGESSGPVAYSEVIANQFNDNGYYPGSGVSYGQPGNPNTSPATAASFNGSSGYVALPWSQGDLSSYMSVALWFRTSSSGVLYSYETDTFPSSPSTGHNYTPALYVGSSGNLHGEFFQGDPTHPISTSTPVNDGKWHFAVLTAQGASQTMYLDGSAVGTLSGPIIAAGQHAQYAGGGYMGGLWPDEPFQNGGDNTGHAWFLNGSISDVAFYNRTLGQPAVNTLWQAGSSPSYELTSVTLPNNKTQVAVTYDAVKDRATKVTDANGGSWSVGSPSVSGSSQEYRGQVLASQPSGYWRLSDWSGTQAANQVYVPRPIPNNGTYSNVALGAAGPMTGSLGSATFDGATTSVQLPASMIPTQGPTAIALWFKTTSPGTILSYQDGVIDSNTTRSTFWNPALYVGTDGRLRAQLWTGAIGNTMTSTPQVTDGKWHFAVLSADTNSQQTLYLDGQATAGSLNASIGINGTHYLYLGAGNADGWPSAPTTPFGHFNGQLANAALFPHGLSAGTVSSLYAQANSQSAAQGAGLAKPSAYDAAIISAHPTGYWRLDDAGGNQATELISSAALAQNHGTENNTTGGQPGPWASGTASATSFNGTTSSIQLPATALPKATSAATASLWFKTSSPGVLYAYQDFPLGNTSGGQPGAPALWNPALYVGTDNKLHGLFMPNGYTTTTVSDTTVTDNTWHLATLVANGTNEQLYLDGKPTGTPVNGTVTYNGDGYAYLGAGTIQGSWPATPTDTSGHFNGQLADFALYRYALTAPTIAGQYQAATTANNGTGLDAAGAYRTAVVEANPTAYWRLDDPSGSTYASDELGTALPDQAAGTYTSTTLNTSGPTADPAQGSATFNGTNSLLQLPANAAPTKSPATVDMWFKTTTSGVLYSYQDAPMGATQGSYNPALYVGTDGHIHASFWTGSPNYSLTSDRTVTDGTWHQVVLAGDDSGQTLYLDGTPSAASTTGNKIYYNGTPYVYIGAGTNTGWPQAGNQYFNGSIAEVSYYPAKLAATAIAGQYTAMRNGANPLPVTTVTVTDPGNNKLTYTYDTRTAKLTSYSDASGNTTSYTYDTNGYLYTVTDPDGHTTTTGHDTRGNTVSRTTCQNPATCHTSYATYYLDTTNPLNVLNDTMTSSSDARSNGPGDTTYRTTYVYNTAGQLTSTTTPATPDFPKGRVTYTSYSTGLEPAVGGGTQPAGLVAATSIALDAGTYPTTSNIQPNQIVLRWYDAHGNAAQVTGQGGTVTNSTFDNLGRPSTKTDTCTNCGQGQSATATTTTYTWDGQSNPLTQADPATTDAVTGTIHTPKTSWTYDADGDKTSRTTTDATGGDQPRTTTWAYNAANDHLASTTDPAGSKTSYTYDTYGNTATKTDAAGTTYAYTYSPQRWLQQSAITNYTGNPNNPLTARTQVIDSRAYDPAGRLATDTDAMGRTTHTYYNDDNTVAEIDLDAFHNFTTTTQQFDGTTRNIVLQTNTYDPAGELTQRVTGAGKTTVANTYDPAGRPTGTTLDPGGLNRTTTQTYDAAGDILTTKLTDGTTTRETDTTYDTLGNPLTETVLNTPQNSVTTHTYDQRGLVLTTTSPNGNTPGATPANYTSTYFHDPAGQLTITDTPPTPTTTFNTTTGQPVTLPAATAETRTGYNTYGEPTETKDPLGNITTTTYDADGNQTAVAASAYTAPGTSTTITPTVTKQYDALGRPTTTTVDPSGLNRVTTTSYDQLGDPVKITQPPVNGSTPTETFTYDLDQEQLSTVDPIGAVSQHTYDDLGRLITSTDLVRQPSAAAYTSALGYDDAGNPTLMVDQRGQSSKASYDAAGEVSSRTDALGNVTHYAYDLSGQLIRTTRPDGSLNTLTADQAGHITATSALDRDGTTQLATTSSVYDADGNTVAATDANGHTTTYAFDAADRMVQQSQPLAAGTFITTSFGYDAAGNQTRYSHTRAAGGSSADVFYTFNSLGLPEATIDPPTAAYPNLADRTYTVAYDAAGEPVSSAQPGGVTDTHTYDADGRLSSESGAGAQAVTATRTFGHDLDGRLTSATAGTSTNTYTYDDRGLILTQAGSGGIAGFGYDATGNLSTRTDKGGTATFGYDADERLSSMYEPLTGVQQSYQYDSAGNLASISNGAGGAVRSLAYDGQERLTGDVLKNPSGAVEASISYGYDPQGHITSKSTTGFAGSGSNTYGYDWAGRLNSWTSSAGTTAYAYDNDGNLVQSGQTTTTYDDRDRRISSGSTTYTYDARGTLTGTTTPGGTTSSTYDAFDQLASNGSAGYNYDALGRLTNAGSAAFNYDRTTDAVTADGNQIYERSPEGALVALTSAAGPVLAYSDKHNDLVGTFTASAAGLSGSTCFDPWGAVIATSGVSAGIGYQGGWTDPTTKLVNTASRWYDPTAGSFTSRDTLTLTPRTAAHANRYGYADGNPLGATDPSGHDSNALDGMEMGLGAMESAAAESGNDFRSGGDNEPARDAPESSTEAEAQAEESAAEERAADDENDEARVQQRRLKELDEEQTERDLAEAQNERIEREEGAEEPPSEVGAEPGTGPATPAVEPAADPAASPATGRPIRSSGARGSAGSSWRPTGASSGYHGAADGTRPTAETGLGEAPSNAKPEGNGSPGPNNTITRQPGEAPRLGTSPTDPVQVAAKSNPVVQSESIAPQQSDAAPPQVENELSDGLSSDGSQEGGKCSFSPDTPVLLEDGKAKPIGQVEVGDKVETAAPATGEHQGSEQVTATHINHDSDLIDLTVASADGHQSTVHTTANHPFWDTTKHSWTPAGSLPTGDRLQAVNGVGVTVAAVTETPGEADRYNLTVDKLHTYYVLAGTTPVLVHNTCGEPYDDVAAGLGNHITTGQVVDAAGSPIGAPVMSGENGSWRDIEDFLADSPNISNPRSGPIAAATHVESKIAWAMRSHPEVTSADVVINNPKGVCPAPFGCTVAVPAILRSGQTMRVFYPGATEPVILRGVG